MVTNTDNTAMWNERYKDSEYFYGTEPNDFLRENFYNIAKGGKVLCIADGEGRNSVFLAAQGYKVTALDLSEWGLEKARKLASKKMTSITTICADINTYALEESYWDGIVVIFAHLPKTERLAMYHKIFSALKPGACIIMEVYSPEQITFATGGPKTEDLLPTLDEIKKAFSNFKIVNLKDVRREIHEGKGHTGMSATIQLIAIRPAEDEKESH